MVAKEDRFGYFVRKRRQALDSQRRADGEPQREEVCLRTVVAPSLLLLDHASHLSI